jgi:hypothetical protein
MSGMSFTLSNKQSYDILCLFVFDKMKNNGMNLKLKHSKLGLISLYSYINESLVCKFRVPLGNTEPV